jgi:hypothetical protein
MKVKPFGAGEAVGESMFASVEGAMGAESSSDAVSDTAVPHADSRNTSIPKSTLSWESLLRIIFNI